MLSPSQNTEGGTRERARKKGRQERVRQLNCEADSSAEVLMAVFRFAASFHRPAAGSSHTATAFFLSFLFFPFFSCPLFFVKQKRVRCLRALKSERQREKKDLKMNNSFDHMSGSFGLC